MAYFRNHVISAILLCQLCWAVPVRADSFDDMEQWSIVTLDARVTPKVRLYGEVQPRFGDAVSQVDRLLLRSAVGVQVTPSMSVWQGYVWTPSYQRLSVDEGQFHDSDVTENRLYQQVLFENKHQKLKIINRTRLEQRFIEGAGQTSWRIRHMLRLVHPLAKSQKWSWVAYEEIFFNFNDTPAGPQSGFDQNRLFVGVNRKLSDHAVFEVGYLHNPVNVFNNPVNRVNHAIVAALNMQF